MIDLVKFSKGTKIFGCFNADNRTIIYNEYEIIVLNEKIDLSMHNVIITNNAYNITIEEIINAQLEKVFDIDSSIDKGAYYDNGKTYWTTIFNKVGQVQTRLINKAINIIGRKNLTYSSNDMFLRITTARGYALILKVREY